MIPLKNNSMAPETQLQSFKGAGFVLLTGVCGLDGHSQAPMDGFKASREKDNPSPWPIAEHEGENNNLQIVRMAAQHPVFTVIAIVVLLVPLFAPTVLAKPPTADEIMERVYDREQATTLAAVVQMVLIDRDGQQRSRKLHSYVKREEGVTKKAIFFLEPADVRGTGFLTYDYTGDQQEDEQWIYLPAMHRAKRIAGGGGGGSFMGSDFSYGDFARKPLEDYTYTLRQETNTGESPEWVIEALPRDDTVAERDGYSRSLLLVRQDNDQISRMVHWVRGANTLKYYTVETFDERDGVVIATRIRAKTVSNGEILHQTLLTTSDIRLNTSLDDSLFTVPTLESGRFHYPE